MQLLSNKNLNPINTKVAFIKGDIIQIVEEFVKWQTPLIAVHRNTFIRTHVNGSLEKALMELCPLTTAERRKFLFIPTQTQWVAFFDNGHTGTDRTIPEVLSKNLNTECVYVINDNDTAETILDIFGKVGFTGTNLIRSISVIKENGWKFYQYGEPLPFEKKDAYNARLIKNRFNRSILTDYLNQLGIDISNEAYYDPKNSILLSKQGPKFENTKELTLTQAQNFFI